MYFKINNFSGMKTVHIKQSSDLPTQTIITVVIPIMIPMGLGATLPIPEIGMITVT